MLLEPSSEVNNFTSSADEPFGGSIKVSWGFPCRPNGKIKEFVLRWRGEKNTLGDKKLDAIPNQTLYEVWLTNMRAETSYFFTIYAVNEGSKENHSYSYSKLTTKSGSK